MTERYNNFDLVRLFAAMQVAIVHIASHLQLGPSPFLSALGLFPGVPIFFFVSGFLVSRSFERSRDIRQYFRNRLLRIFPGLWACFAVSVVSVAVLYGVPWMSKSFWIWSAAQLSILQFYNPDFLRGYGVGVLNGSLWTIPVEMQYYAILPLIYVIVGWQRQRVFIAFTVVALCVHLLYSRYVYGSDALEAKLLQVSIVPWLGLFLAGVMARRLWSFVRRFVEGKFAFWLIAYTIAAAAFQAMGVRWSGNAINTFAALFLFGCVLSAAFTVPGASEHLLKGNDISYGVYLYHMPVVNAYLELGRTSSWRGLWGILTVTCVLAIVSWLVVEKPALRLKWPGRSSS